MSALGLRSFCYVLSIVSVSFWNQNETRRRVCIATVWLATTLSLACAGRSTSHFEPPFSQDYPGWRDDVALFRTSNGGAAGRDSFDAAERIFTKIKFVGMERWQVLELLGPPHGYIVFPRSERLNRELSYTLYEGLNGLIYQLWFKRGRVTRIEFLATE